MVERPLEPNGDAFAPEVTPHVEAEAELPHAPTITTDDGYDATWTERMLNSLVAWGRRERGLVRHAQSDTQSYVAYSARARPIAATAKGTVDRGTVELDPTEAGEDAARAQQALRAQYAATTVVIRRKHFSWWWVALAVGAVWGLCVIGNRNSGSPTTSRGNAETSLNTPPAETSQPLILVPAPSESGAGPAARASLKKPSLSGEKPSLVDHARRPPQPSPQARPNTPSPASSSPGEAHKEFVDVVSQY